MPDNPNPKMMFQGTETELLSKIVKGEIDPVALAKKELEARGINKEGKWVGWWNVKD